MNRINHWFRQSVSTQLALTLVPLVTFSTVLAGTIAPANADRTRECSRYGVVRDRSDMEAPLLPRQSIAHCARSYQTLYQTYRVRSSDNARERNSELNRSTEGNAGTRDRSSELRSIPNSDTQTESIPSP